MKDKKINSLEIAKKANVSPSTVSRVLNHRHLVKDTTIQIVENAMLELGYALPETSLSKLNKQRILVINVPAFQNSFYQEIIKGAQSSANAHGYQILITDSPIDSGSINDFCNLLTYIGASGVILLNQVRERYLELINNTVPLVQCCEYNENSSLPYVSIDDYTAAEIATEHLINCGRNKIAFINGTPNNKYAVDRKKGFYNALNKADISTLNQWVVHLPEINFEMAYATTCKLLNSEVRPNAFFVASDVFAAAVIRAAHRFNLTVPNDIMVVGFDNIDLSQMTTPSITTMNQPKFQLGYYACEMLIDKIEYPNNTQNSLLLSAELIVRESTRLG